MNFGPPDISMPTDGETRDFAWLANTFIDIINTALIPVLIALLLVFIIWKVVDMFLLHAGDEQKREDGKRLLVISVVVMSVIVAIWGIIAFLRTSIFG